MFVIAMMPLKYIVRKCIGSDVMEELELPNQEIIRTFGGKNYKYLKNRDERNSKTESLIRTRKPLETKLCSRNRIKRINVRPVTLRKIHWTIFKMNEEKTLTNRPKNKETEDDVLYPRDGIDKYYVSCKEGGRRLASSEECVDATIQEPEEYNKKSKEILIIATSNSNGNIRTNSKTAK